MKETWSNTGSGILVILMVCIARPHVSRYNAMYIWIDTGPVGTSIHDGPAVNRLLIEASNEGTLQERNSAAVKYRVS